MEHSRGGGLLFLLSWRYPYRSLRVILAIREISSSRGALPRRWSSHLLWSSLLSLRILTYCQQHVMADSPASDVTTGSNLPDPKITSLAFTDADFAEKPPSHKIGVCLPIPSDSQRLRGPNILQWMTYVETTLHARLLFKHCSHPPLSSTSPHFAAWQAEEHFIRGWLLNQTLHPDIYSKFRNRLTVKYFWDQAKAFGGSDRDNWCLSWPLDPGLYVNRRLFHGSPGVMGRY